MSTARLRMLGRLVLPFAIALVALCATASAAMAHGYDVTICTCVTSNMTLTAGEYSATGPDANLSVTDLAAALTTQDVFVDSGTDLTQLDGQTGVVHLTTSFVTAATHNLTIGADSILLDGDIDIGGIFTLGSPTTLGTDVDIDAVGLDQSSSIDGAHALTIHTATVVDLHNSIGHSTPLTSLDVTNDTNYVNLDTNITTTGAVTFHGEVIAFPTASIDNENVGTPADVTLANVDAENATGDLTVTSSGTVTVGDVGVTNPLTHLSLTGAAIDLPGTVKTSGNQTYDGPVTLGQNTTLTNTAGLVSFDGTVNGGFGLTASGDTSFAGAIGDVTPITTLSLGNTDLGANVTTSGTQTYSGAVNLSGDATLTSSTSGADIVFGSTVDGAHTLTLANPAGSTDIDAEVGGVTPLTALIAHAVVTPLISSLTVKTTGNQSYGSLATSSSAYTSTGGTIDVAGLTELAGTATAFNAVATDLEGDVTPSLGGSLLADGGTMTIGGAVSADTEVDAGTLVMDGADASGVAADAGTTVRGTGSISTLTSTGATVAPGDGHVGTLTVGTLTLDGASTFAPAIGAGGAVSSVQATSAALDDAVFAPTYPSTPGVGTTATVLASGTTTGTFHADAEGGTFAGDGSELEISHAGGSGHDVTATRIAATTATTLTQSTTGGNQGDSVTFTASVAPTLAGVTGPTSGTVTFVANGTQLGTAAVGTNGTAIFTTTALPAGADQVTAAFAGDAEFGASTSAAVTHPVVAQVVPVVITPPAAHVVPVVVITPPAAKLSASAAATKGISATVSCSTRCRAQGRVYIAVSQAKSLGLLPKTSRATGLFLIGNASVYRTSATTVRITVKLTTRLRRLLGDRMIKVVFDYTTGTAAKTAGVRVTIVG